MVSPRMLRKLSPLLALSLGFFTTIGAQDAQETTDSTTTSSITTRSTSGASSITSAVSSSYSLSTNSAGSVTSILISATTDNDTESSTSSSSTKTSKPPLILTGKPKTSSSISITSTTNGTATTTQSSTSTSSEPLPTNTQPCNGWPEFCNRRYSNLTQIGAHNSPFVQPNNVAANQDYGTTTQLDDGVRLLQVQAHFINGTFYMCHGSCEMLNAGLLSDWLRDVAQWVYDHPYDVVTLVIGNALYTSATEYEKPFEDSGLKQFTYTPSKNPMARGDWPTLGELVLMNTRVVVFMDYEANQGAVPYILDQFIHVWETPFDPTSRDFPCTIDRPPDLSEADAVPRMYIANHNLNTQLELVGIEILVPTRPLINETNAVNGTGSLGVAAETCYVTHGRPPNWLLVDYYDAGSGSVFEVAAKWNNVTYAGPCCGFVVNGAGRLRSGLVGVFVVLVGALLV